MLSFHLFSAVSTCSCFYFLSSSFAVISICCRLRLFSFAAVFTYFHLPLFPLAVISVCCRFHLLLLSFATVSILELHANTCLQVFVISFDAMLAFRTLILYGALSSHGKYFTQCFGYLFYKLSRLKQFLRQFLHRQNPVGQIHPHLLQFMGKQCHLGHIQP